MKNLPLWGSILAAGALLTVSVLATAQNAGAPGGPSTQNPRIALVIGEESYPDKTLATSANDAGLVAQVLQAAGFDVVGARDLDEKSIQTALRDFLTRADAAGPNMQAFVYLAGRAVQYEGDNFFVPVDAQIAHGADVPIEAVRLTDFTHALASAPGVARIVVLDGARANPYARAGLPLAGDSLWSSRRPANSSHSTHRQDRSPPTRLALMAFMQKRSRERCVRGASRSKTFSRRPASP